MDQKHLEAQFLQLILGLQGTAWMLLGKVANPMTGTIEKNLEAAKATIDTLIMLKEKTKGNLTKIEEELLNGALQQLQVNYVEEAKKPDAREEKGKEKTEGKDKADNETPEQKQDVKVDMSKERTECPHHKLYKKDADKPKDKKQAKESKKTEESKQAKSKTRNDTKD